MCFEKITTGSCIHVFVQNTFFFFNYLSEATEGSKKENKCYPKYSSFQAMLILWVFGGKRGLLLMLSDFYFQAQQGKIAAEDEEIGEDSQFMMLAKKVTAKALQKNGELLALHRGCLPGLLVLEPWR